MRYLLSMLIVALTGCASSVALKPHCAAPDPETLMSVVQVRTFDGGSGSGVVVGPKSVLTAAHVVEQTDTVLVGLDDVFYKARVHSTDPDVDLALLEVDTRGLTPVRLASSRITISEAVWAVGYPRAEARRTTYGAVETNENGRLRTTAFIDSGNSGGGLLRCNAGVYELAGLVHGFVARVEDGEYMNTGDSTSIAADKVRDFIYMTRGIDGRESWATTL